MRGYYGEQVKVICHSDALLEGAAGVRFTVYRAHQPLPAFAVRYGGAVYAFVNRCAHRGVELDWEQGRFFDAQGKYLVCATHGALYDPATGNCTGGPCRGAALTRVPMMEVNGKVCLVPDAGWDLA
jgi:nitrite reductase/ring-hydroxylating ferredoxin subunit